MDIEQATVTYAIDDKSYLEESKIEETEVSQRRFCVVEEHNENMKLIKAENL